MPRILTILLGIAALAGIAFACVKLQGPAIEADLAAKAQMALAAGAKPGNTSPAGTQPGNADPNGANGPTVESAPRSQEDAAKRAHPTQAPADPPTDPPTEVPTVRTEPRTEPPAEPPAEPMDARALALHCQDELDALLMGRRVLFGSNSAVIRPDSYALLDDLAEVLSRCPLAQAEVVGHTDSDGDPNANLRLSRDRAQAVADYLVRNGVGGDRLIPVGLGDINPIADNETAEGRAQNRRIEFRVRGLYR